MPSFDLSNPLHQLERCLDAPDTARRHALAALVLRHCGPQARDEMIAAYKQAMSAKMSAKQNAAISARAELRAWRETA